MDLRNTVEALLRKKGRTKKDLSTYLSISQGNLNRTLMGTSVDKEILIADFFEITRDELINSDYSEPNSEDKYLSIIASQQETIKTLSETIKILSNK